ncbi:MAG: ABC transporter permease [Actinomycetes bacterium]
MAAGVLVELRGALHVAEGAARAYRRSWRGSAVSSFLTPVLYLAAMGLGLGGLVDRGAGDTALDVPYLQFLGPGLLAATAMQVGAGDGAWPVLAGVEWRRTYRAVLATPVTPAQLVGGHLLWVAARLLLVALWFAVVLVAFDVAPLVRGLAAAPAAVLVGLAFCAPMTAVAASSPDHQRLTFVFRYGVVPLFLFSGTFFPVSQLPDAVEPLAVLTPLWHGVELVRSVVTGAPPAWHPAAHVAVQVAVLTLGGLAARRAIARRVTP